MQVIARNEAISRYECLHAGTSQKASRTEPLSAHFLRAHLSRPCWCPHQHAHAGHATPSLPQVIARNEAISLNESRLTGIRQKHIAQNRSPLSSSALTFPARVGVLTNTLTQGTQLHPFRRSSRGTKRSYRMSAGYKETCTIITNTFHAINNSSWAASIHSRPLHPKTPYP